jgi:hypothetical protein
MQRSLDIFVWQQILLLYQNGLTKSKCKLFQQEEDTRNEGGALEPQPRTCQS